MTDEDFEKDAAALLAAAEKEGADDEQKAGARLLIDAARNLRTIAQAMRS